jgi:hypothetical protein
MGRRNTGAHVNRNRVRIFREGDHLSLKFFKILCHKNKVSYVGLVSGAEFHCCCCSQTGKLEDWFFSKEHALNPDRSLPRRDFSELVSQLDFHEVNPKTGSVSAGKQLIPEQLLTLTRLVTPDGGSVTFEEVEAFTLDAESDLTANYESHKMKLLVKRNAKHKVKQAEKGEKSSAVNSVKAEQSLAVQKQKQEKAAALDKLHDALHNAHLLGHLMRFLFEQCMPDCTSEWRPSREDTLHSAHASATTFLLDSTPATQWGAFFGQTIKTCGHDESNLLCESVSKTIWGDESFAELLRFKVLQELEGHRDFYEQRVGHALYMECVHSLRHQLGMSEGVQDRGAKKKASSKTKKKAASKNNSEQCAELHVHLLNAKNLRGSTGFADPMVQLELGKQKFKSTVKSKTNSPVWGESFVFRLPTLCASLAHSPLKVTVIDSHGLLSSDVIGAVELNQADLRAGVVWKDVHPLGKPVKGDTKGASANLYDTGMELELELFIATGTTGTNLQQYALANAIGRPIFTASRYASVHT